MPIHQSAIVEDGAQVHASAIIGPFAVVHANAIIHAGTQVESHCVIGRPSELAAGRELTIGQGSIVRSHSVLYQGSDLGPGLETGHHVAIREGTRAGRNLRVGTQSDVQGDCVIGDYVRLHGGTQIGKMSVIDSFAWIYPQVVLTNDPFPPGDEHMAGVHVGAYAVVATASVVLPGVKIGEHAVVAANSLVKVDVPPHMLVGGNPAIVVCPARKILLPEGAGPAYPWPRRFSRGYPPAVVEEWQKTSDWMERDTDSIHAKRP